MAKLTLFDLSSGSFTVDLLNANFALIETALENTLSRDGTAPNPMNANLDMNSNRILNLPQAVSAGEPVTYSQLLALSTLNLYTPENHTHAWTDITGKPSTFTPATHTHAISDVTGLQTQLTALAADISTLETQVYVFVQSGTPTAYQTGDIWLW